MNSIQDLILGFYPPKAHDRSEGTHSLYEVKQSLSFSSAQPLQSSFLQHPFSLFFSFRRKRTAVPQERIAFTK